MEISKIDSPAFLFYRLVKRCRGRYNRGRGGLVFDCLWGQEAVCEALQAELARGQLPPALLFTGPSCAGKLTAGFELARLLHCSSSERADDCSCPDCRQHRSLSHPGMLLLGSCSLADRYRALTKRLQQSDDPRLAEQWWQLLRQVLLRFSPVLWGDRGQNEREKKALHAAAELGNDLLTREGNPQPENLEAVSRQVMAACQGLGKSPLAHIRRLRTWAQRANDRYRVALITGADQLSDAVSNALLKMLEEPPPRFLLLLTSRAPRCIPATLRSRLRTYRFAARSPELQQRLIAHFFACPNEDSLLRFFSPWMGDEQRRWAEGFLQYLRRGCSYREWQEEFGSPPLDELVSAVSQLLVQQPRRCGLEWRQAWGEQMAGLALANEYNLSPQSTLRNLFQQMEGVRMADDGQ